MTRLRIGSRGSRLARWQAERVASLLRGRYRDLEVEILLIATTGDRIADAPLAQIGGKGIFTKEIEEALLEDRIDVAVHSLKDLPTALPAGLALGAVLARHDPRDALLSPRGTRFAELPPGARLATSSLRRRAQLLHARGDLAILPMRGNVPTRIEKAEEQMLDGVVLARAGVERLGLGDRITEVLSFDLLLPAPGQGAIGVEIRSGDEACAARLRPLEDRSTRAATDAERAFLRALGGGCQVPIGAHANTVGERPETLRLEGMVAEPSGARLLRASREGAAARAAEIGEALAADLRARGAGEILATLEAGTGPEPEAP